MGRGRSENQIGTSNWKTRRKKSEMGLYRSAMYRQLFKSFEQTERFARHDFMEM
jgi:hypothetical protein